VPRRCSTDQLEDAQQAEGAQHRQARLAALYELDDRQHHDAPVEEVEAVGQIAEQALGDDLQRHLDGEQRREEVVRVLQDVCQRLRLQAAW